MMMEPRIVVSKGDLGASCDFKDFPFDITVGHIRKKIGVLQVLHGTL